ncbi:alpha/beta fold hydrolase [Actinoplanes sp. NPDC023714]|uniref:alpha/beta hydrolase n=1 Tax=Actinoplanes sp. NPDC023714 TaxID=3154322 RepID=UPI0033EF7281
MKDPTTVSARRPRRTLRLVLAGLAAVVVLLVTALYTWPVAGDALREAGARQFGYAEAQALARQAGARDTGDPDVRTGCPSTLLDHGRRTAKAVLMLHGYTACPGQLSGLAKHYFDAGYNVYVPRAPLHGITDRTAHAGVQAEDLVGYAADAWNIAAALGDDVGVVGISGGAVLATWLAEYRADSVRRLLVLSPFYRPAADKAPGAAVRPMTALYGFGLLPDHVNENGYSFAALAQYLRITFAYRDLPGDPALRNAALVVSPGDTFIDQETARAVPRELAADAGATFAGRTLPGDLGLEHDIVTEDRLGPATAELYPLYLKLYENRSAA